MHPSFRIPSEELKLMSELMHGHEKESFRIPSEELKPGLCLDFLDRVAKF